MGVPRTGSTAMQIAFVRQRTDLLARGVRYPTASNDSAAARGQTVAGNGVALLPHLTAAEAQPSTLDQFRQELDRADGRTVLYSSEALFRSIPARLEELINLAERDGYAARSVLFVRDVAGHALSVYSQNVRSGNCRLSFGDYV